MMNRNRSTERDLELLSAYLDGQLSANERAELERRLAAEPELRLQLHQLRRTVQVLHQAPAVRAPRNYTLDPAIYSRPAPWWSSLLHLRIAGSLALAMLVVALTGVLLIRLSPGFGGGVPAAPAANVAPERQTFQTAAPVIRTAPAQNPGSSSLSVPARPPLAGAAQTLDQVQTATSAESSTGGAAVTAAPGGITDKSIPLSTAGPVESSGAASPAVTEAPASGPNNRIAAMATGVPLSAVTVVTATQGSVLHLTDVAGVEGERVTLSGVYQVTGGEPAFLTCTLADNPPFPCQRYRLDRELNPSSPDLEVLGVWASGRVQVQSFQSLKLDAQALEQLSRQAIESHIEELRGLDWTTVTISRTQPLSSTLTILPAAVGGRWTLAGVDLLADRVLVRFQGPTLPIPGVASQRVAVIYTLIGLTDMQVQEIIATAEESER